MSGHKWALLLAALVALGGAWVMPQAREPESLQWVSALAVDGEEEVTVTAVTGVRTSEEEAPQVLRGTGDSLTAACGDLRECSARRAYLGQTQQLLAGESTAVPRLLDFVVKHRQLRLDTLLYIVRGSAGTALEASASQTAAETGGQDPRGVTVGEILPRLAEGDYALVPALAPNEEGLLAPAGWAVLNREGVTGYLEGEAALGAALLNGKVDGRGVTLPGGSVELGSCRCWAAEGELRCALTAQITQGQPRAEDLEAWGREAIRGALEPGWNCWGLNREAEALCPWAWEELRGLDVSGLEIQVEGKLKRGETG